MPSCLLISASDPGRGDPGSARPLLGLAVPPRHGLRPGRPKPAKKDSPTRTKPKDVELTPRSPRPRPVRATRSPTTSPRSSTPAGTSTLTRRQQKGDGPRNTRFDLFDTGGLTPSATGNPPARRSAGRSPPFPTSMPSSSTRTRSPGASSSRCPPACPGPKNPPLPGELPDLRRQPLQLPRPVDLARRRPDIWPRIGQAADAAKPAAVPVAVDAPKPKKKDSIASDPAEDRHPVRGRRAGRGEAGRNGHLQGHGQARPGPGTSTTTPGEQPDTGPRSHSSTSSTRRG